MSGGESVEGSKRKAYIVLVPLSLAVSSLYLVMMLMVTSGHFVPQVSDLYLIAQYAKGFAEGHPFQYNPGETATTGATSLLHTVFLAVAHRIGFQGEGLIAFAVLSGACFALLCAMQVEKAGRILSGSSRVALLAGALTILNGPLAWSFHYGADIALVLFLSSWLFAAWVYDASVEGKEGASFVLPACLLALSRPEALALVVFLSVWRVWNARRQNHDQAPRGLWFVPVLAGVIPPVTLRLFVGSAGSSFSQKLLWENWGGFGAAVFSVEYWTDLLRGVLLGFYPASQRLGLGGGNAPYFAAPFLLVFVFVALMTRSEEMRRAGAFVQGALLTAVLVTPTIHMGVHSNRYLLFALPPLLILFSVGVGRVATWMEAAVSVPWDAAFARLSALSVVFGCLSVLRFALIYADSAASTYNRDEALFEFVRAKLPSTATFLNNGSAIEYQTGRRSVNLSGVVTPGFADILPAETEASAFEMLSRSGMAPLPPYLIAFDSYISGSPAWGALISGPPVFVTSSFETSELAIYPTRSELLGRQLRPLRSDITASHTLVDSLNISDPIDERKHAYTWRSQVGTRSIFATLKLDRYVGNEAGAGTELADGGRVIMGFEEMNVNTPNANADLWVVVRTHPEPSARVRHPEGERRLDLSLPETALRLSTELGKTDWQRKVLTAGWNEITYRVPATFLTGATNRLRIEGRYSAYWYGFYQ